MGPFTTREIATAFWLLALAIWSLSHDRVRPAALSVIVAVLHSKITIPASLLAMYLAGIVWGLWSLGFWELGLLKDTVLWFFLSGLGFAYSSIVSKSDTSSFGQIVRKQLSLLIVLEFIMNAYTFHLIVELLLIPFLVLLAMVEQFAKLKKGHEDAGKFASSLQMFTGFGMFALVIARLVGDRNSIEWSFTLREIVLPVLLTIGLIPAVFAFTLYSRYETLFLGIGLGRVDARVKRRAQWRLFRRLGLNLRKIDEYQRREVGNLMRIHTMADLDQFLPRG